MPRARSLARSLARPLARPLTGSDYNWRQETVGSLFLPTAWFDSSKGVKTDGAAQFDSAASEHFTSASADFIPSDTAFTFAFWVKFDDISADRYLLNKYGASGNRGFLLYMQASNARLRAQLSANGTGVSTISTAISSITTDTWYFVVLRYDGANIDLRLDETDITPVAHAGGVYDSSATFYVGAADAGATPHDGAMDSLFYYRSRRLSNDDCDEMYAAGAGLIYDDLSANLLTGLTAAYNFDETSGNRIDASGNGHTLTDVNTVTRSIGIAAGSATDGDTISIWQDQTSNAYNLTMPTLSTRPVYNTAGPYGRESIVMDGSDDYFHLLDADLPVLCLAYSYKRDTVTDWYLLGYDADVHGLYEEGGTDYVIHDSAGIFDSVSHALAPEEWTIDLLKWNNLTDDLDLWRNGVYIGNSTAPWTGTIPADNLLEGFGGEIGDILLWADAGFDLSTAQIAHIFQYLAAKRGVAI